MAGSSPPRGACACVCKQESPGVGVPPRHPPCWPGEEDGGGHICHSVPPPRQGLVGQKVLRCKTIAEREIQLVKGLVAISQALKKKRGRRERKRGGDVFMAFFIYLFHSFSRGGSPSPRLPLAPAWICLFKKLFRVHICHIYLTPTG